MSGVDVPRFGTSKDKILRDYLVKKSSKEIAKNKVLAYSAIGILGALHAPKEAIDYVRSSWEDYVNLELYMEGAKKLQENDMMEEYMKHWKHVRPKLNITKNGNGKSTTTLSVESLKPKIQ